MVVAQTLGPVGWGWNSVFLSGLDQKTCNEQGGSCWSNPPDRAAHGGVDFGAWYLQQMAAYEKTKGRRILARLFEEFCRSPQQLPERYARRAESGSLQRTVCDYLAGMTDRYAKDEYLRLFQPYTLM